MLVSPSVDPEIEHSSGVSFHICRPLTERMHVRVRFEKYPRVLRVTREQSQSPPKLRAENFDTPLPRPPFDFYSLGVFKGHAA